MKLIVMTMFFSLNLAAGIDQHERWWIVFASAGLLGVVLLAIYDAVKEATTESDRRAVIQLIAEVENAHRETRGSEDVY